ncbi:OLC1v1021074C1 [Oldenlandia corymbosa var. corymbosa]|uniref:OLC1v1021074C1 n=1 Tax=Oldenlandia corymbosa var. corymbosa TaxID=529605 RepID=A0AAV1BXA8_OLDCO|nr:OLC1v1021074C1 [Oldenlandia corymbosa var. corymbosa]
MSALDEMGTRASSQLESVVYNSKKLEDDIHSLGLKIKQHEENINFLKRQKHLVDDKIVDMQVALGKYHSADAHTSDNGDPFNKHGEEETVEQILKTENTAAALLCQLKIQHASQDSQFSWMKDVIGVVATIGRVEDENLSWILSEYLGTETMQAVVCRTHTCVKSLEMYDKDGRVNETSGLYGFGASIGKTLEGRFLAICLENMRPYVGDFVADDPQRRLDLLKPKLPTGETPSGFLGFAVNMINIDHSNLYFVTTNGLGLRETLFFNLFSYLQVYKTREDMLQALPLIVDGAVSLDGGIITSKGMFYLGKRTDVGLKFPKCSRSVVPDTYFVDETAMKEEKWKRERLQDDIRREQIVLDQTKFNYEIKKQEFLKMLAQCSTYATNQQLHQPARVR